MEHIVKQPQPLTFEAPPCIARYAPIFWEPIPGTGERIVAMLAIEPHLDTVLAMTPATYVVLPSARIRAMLGVQRASRAIGILKEAASYMTWRQAAGLPLEDLSAPFHGFTTGPAYVARAYSTEQLIDAAVRSVSAFGSAEGLLEEADGMDARHTGKTAEFLRALRRGMVGDDPTLKERFEKRLILQDAPEVTIDYAWHKWLVQVTSLPHTARQALNTQREAQSKLLELDLARKGMDGNAVAPMLLVNQFALSAPQESEAFHEATEMLKRLKQLAELYGAELRAAPTPDKGIKILTSLG